MAIIEAAVQPGRALAASDILAEVRRLGLRTPAKAVSIIRAERDGR